MNGAESLVRTLVAHGVKVCFTNPGTSEMHFVAALDSVPGMRSSLCLFEGGATGAADGYYRMTGTPASTLLHLGPGLANGVANLHNAKKARSGIVNIVGEHATSHLVLDAPLTADIEGIARPVSHWVKTSTDSAEIAIHGAEAIAVARAPSGQIATLILPGDTAWNPGAGVAPLPAIAAPTPVPEAHIKATAIALRDAHAPLIIAGGAALKPQNLMQIARIAAQTGAKVMSDWSNARYDRGLGHIEAPRVPYVVEMAVAALAPHDLIVLIGAIPPVAFFAYPDKPGILSHPDATLLRCAEAGDDIPGALGALIEATGAQKAQPVQVSTTRAGAGCSGPLTPENIGAVLAALIPDSAIIADEAVTTGRAFAKLTVGSAPHTWLSNCGGSIGLGLPLATGAAMACPDRKVIALTGDGSAMYTLQSLWTMAREAQDVVVLVFANHSYHILRGELTNVGVQNPGPSAIDMLSLNRPDLDWVALARGMGVAGERVTDCTQLADALAAGLSEQGPYLIEVMM